VSRTDTGARFLAAERALLVQHAWACLADRHSSPGDRRAARARIESSASSEFDFGVLADDELAALEQLVAIGEHHAVDRAELAAACRRIADRLDPPAPCARCATLDPADVIRVPPGSPPGALERARAAIAAVARGEVELAPA
jgi:hypothetical protein